MLGILIRQELVLLLLLLMLLLMLLGSHHGLLHLHVGHKGIHAVLHLLLLGRQGHLLLMLHGLLLLLLLLLVYVGLELVGIGVRLHARHDLV